jgi:hypothetical protein
VESYPGGTKAVKAYRADPLVPDALHPRLNEVSVNWPFCFLLSLPASPPARFSVWFLFFRQVATIWLLHLKKQRAVRQALGSKRERAACW